MLRAYVEYPPVDEWTMYDMYHYLTTFLFPSYGRRNESMASIPSTNIPLFRYRMGGARSLCFVVDSYLSLYAVKVSAEQLYACFFRVDFHVRYVLGRGLSFLNEVISHGPFHGI